MEFSSKCINKFHMIIINLNNISLLYYLILDANLEIYTIYKIAKYCHEKLRTNVISKQTSLPVLRISLCDFNYSRNGEWSAALKLFVTRTPELLKYAFLVAHLSPNAVLFHQNLQWRFRSVLFLKKNVHQFWKCN